MNLTIAGGELYVAEFFNDRIQVYGLDGEFRRSVGKAGSAGGEMSAPGGVAVDADGVLYVADFLTSACSNCLLMGLLCVNGDQPESRGCSAAGSIIPPIRTLK